MSKYFSWNYEANTKLIKNLLAYGTKWKVVQEQMQEFSAKQLKSHYDYLAKTRLGKELVQKIELGKRRSKVNGDEVGVLEFWRDIEMWFNQLFWIIT